MCYYIDTVKNDSKTIQEVVIMKFEYKFKKNDMVVNTETGKVGIILKRIGLYDIPCYYVQYENIIDGNYSLPVVEKEENLYLVVDETTLEKSNTNQTKNQTIDEINIEEKKATLKRYFNHIEKNCRTIFKYGRNISEQAFAEKITPCFAREKEIEQIKCAMYRRTKSNALLLGKAGVGKTAIVEGLAIDYNKEYLNGETEEYNMILELNLNALVGGCRYRGDFEERLENVLKELENSLPYNVIIFIDEIHGLNEIGNSEGSTSAGQILKPALARGDIKVIGATTIDEYKQYLKPDTALARRFNNIYIEEFKGEKAKSIISNIFEDYGKHFKIDISEVDITNIYDKSINKISGTFPDNFINIIDETLAIAKCHKEKVVKMSNFDKVLERYYKMDNRKNSPLGFSTI
jgi:ATP-dependent Clp protease ATP-binding subunit ClpA